MQTTLLGLAIAVILAVVAAMVGPFFIDWDQVRPYAENEANQWIGANVRISGPIDARLLPTPMLNLHDVEIGEPGSPRAIRIGNVAVEFALAPLMRGEWRAAEMHIAQPEVTLAIDANGKLAGPQLAPGFAPDKLSIEKLTIDEGRVTLADLRSGTRKVLEKVWFKGDLRSLLGPIKGEGAFVQGGELYGYRASASRANEQGALKIKLNLDPTNHPVHLESEGTLAVEDGAPRYDGTLKVERLAGFEGSDGQRVSGDPWNFTARLKAEPDKALLEKIEFQFGPEERAIKLTGAADVKLSGRPRFDGVLSALQIDLDRALASAMSDSRKPADVLKTLAETFTGALKPGMPGRVGIGIETLTMAGAKLRSVRGDLTTDGDVWNLEGFEFRAPGISQVAVTGQLDVAGERLGFTGPVSVESSDPNALVSWLKGDGDTGSGSLNPLKVEGDVTLSGEKIAIERMRAEIDRKSVEGKLVYEWASDARPARLDADLKAAALDIDSLLALANSARGATRFEIPRDIALGLDADRATIGGLDARQVSAKIRQDENGLQIDRLSIADIGGTSVQANGAIDTRRNIPHGTVSLTVDARDTARMLPLAARFMPESVTALTQLAARVPAAKLTGTLGIAGAGELTTATLALTGQANGLETTFNVTATPHTANVTSLQSLSLKGTPVSFSAQVSAQDSRVLIAKLGLGDYFSVAQRPGRATLTAKGELGGALAVDGAVAAADLDAKAAGTLRYGDDGPDAALRVSLAATDASVLRGGVAATAPVAIALRADAGLSRKALSLNKIEGTLAGTPLTGRLDLKFGGGAENAGTQISGALEADEIDTPALLAAATGLTRKSAKPPNAPQSVPARGSAPPVGSSEWSSAPFDNGLLAGSLADMTGAVTIKAKRALLTPATTAQQLSGDVTFARGKASFEKLQAAVAGGTLSGRFDVDKSLGGVNASADFTLDKMDAAVLLGSPAKPAVTGRLSGQLAFRGSGLSPVALLGALTGSGTVSLEGAQFASLDPKAFDIAVLAIDRGMKVDAGDVSDVVDAALKAGQLAVPVVKGNVSIGAGQIRLTQTTARATGAEAALSGSYDLLDGRLDARVMLTGVDVPPMSGVEQPLVLVSLRGPLDDPQRNVDVSAFSAWLTLRSIEAQTKRLEALEVARRQEEVRQEALERQRREEQAKREALEMARREDEARAEALAKAKRDEQARQAARDKAAADKAREDEARQQQAIERARRESALEQQRAHDAAPVDAAPGTAAPALPAPVEIKPTPDTRTTHTATPRRVTPVRPRPPRPAAVAPPLQLSPQFVTPQSP